METGIFEIAAVKLEITELLYRYARGIDRSDWDLVRSCYHDDAWDDHGLVSAGPDEFIRYVSDHFAHVEASTHLIGNILIDVRGDEAGCESYAYVCHRLKPQDDAQQDLYLGVRYVDQLERRAGGAWLIADRKVAYEWTRLEPVGATMDMTPAVIRGRRDRDDVSYQRLPTSFR